MAKKILNRLVKGTIAASALFAGISIAAPLYSSMNVRGDFNSWGKLPMTLNQGEIWQANAQLTKGNRYKFDVKGDWSINFGDSTPDGVAGLGEGNIIANDSGNYRIMFSDKSKRYSAVKNTLLNNYNQVYLRGTFNNFALTPMVQTSDYVWEAEITFTGAPNDRFKFDIMGDWALNFGDNDVVGALPFSGNAEKSGKDIPITQPGTYKIMFIDAQNLYQITKVGGGGGNGSVAFSVKDTVIQNGQIAYVPYNEVAIYLDDTSPFGGPGPAATTDNTGTATVNNLAAGGHKATFFKMTGSHSYYVSNAYSFDVAANQLANKEFKLNSAKSIVQAYANPGTGKALYLTGQTALAGNWATAYKMTYSAPCTCWTYTGPLPTGLQYKIVKANWVAGETIPTTGVVWEKGANHAIENQYGYIANTVNPVF